MSILGFRFEAFKTARIGYDKMQQLKIPAQWQEEIDLAKRIEKGDKEARRIMIESNLKLAISIARKYATLESFACSSISRAFKA